MSWQTIETAPKQTPVMVVRSRWELVSYQFPEVHQEQQIIANAIYERGYDRSDTLSGSGLSGRAGEWLAKIPNSDSRTVLEDGWAVTHWMPMPDLPKSDAKD